MAPAPKNADILHGWNDLIVIENRERNPAASRMTKEETGESAVKHESLENITENLKDDPSQT